MKTAILISGQLRGFKHIVNNLKSNLINYLGDVDVFFYIPDNTSYKVEEYFSSKYITYAPDEYHDEEGLIDFSNPTQQFLQQWYSLYMCKELITQSNKKYDFIVRTRPDNDFITPLTLDQLDLTKINIPSWGHWGGYNDRFAIGPTNEMEIYCDFYKHCKHFPGNSELRLKHYLDNNNINVNFIDHIHYRVNEDGSRREHP